MSGGGFRRVRVLNVIGSMNVGGAESYLARIAPEIRQHGVELELCLLERVGPLLNALHEAGIAVHGTGFERRRPGTSALRLLPILLETVADIARLVRRGRYDVVQTYLFQADAVGVPGARAGGCRRVIVSRRALHAWRHAPNLPEHLVELGSNLGAGELIANSRVVLEDVERHEQILPRHRGVIYNGVDAAGDVLASPRGQGPLRIVTVGALAPRKGQIYALEALGQVRAAGVDARLTLVGAGPDEEMLRRETERLCLSDAVTFAGQRNPQPFLLAADLFLLPSRQEGFSNALLEAMAAGLPAVVTDVGGNAEAVVDGLGGSVVPPENSEALASSILAIAGRRDRLAEMGRENRERVLRHFTIAASAQQLARWYREGPFDTSAAR